MSTEVEIGRSKRALRAYSFDDIALVPARRTRDTSEVRVGWQIDAYHVDLPVMASPMDSVMSPETAILVGRLGGIGVLDLEGLWTRYEDPTEALERIRRADPSRATSVLQEVYRAPVRPELITERLTQIRASGVVVAGRLSPAQTRRHWRTAVEAGVDLDFPCVYREINGLDSIVQAAGRCNREGRRSAEESVVHVFSLEKLAQSAQLAAEITKNVARSFAEDLASPEAIRRYFEELYDLSGKNRLDKKDIMGQSGKFAFADIADDVRLIEDRTKPIFIPQTEEGQALLVRLEQGERSRSLMRKVGRYIVTVYTGYAEAPFEQLAAQGKIRMLDENLAVLVDMEAYDSQKGLSNNVGEGEGVFL